MHRLKIQFLSVITYVHLLIDIKDLDNYKSRAPIPLECYCCHNTFYKEQHFIKAALKGTKTLKYCSSSCQSKARITGQIVKCVQCGNKVFKQVFYLKKKKNLFCSSRCGGLYNTSHKTKGTRRSKLEKYIEKELPKIYSDLILYNDRTAILAELDIYIPSLKLAFELNGIFHYEQIYESTPLSDVQRRDKNKMICCFQKGIELCVIDTTSLKYFKEEKARKFLDIIIDIINRARGMVRTSK